MLNEIAKYKWQISIALLLIFNGVGLFGILLSEDPLSFLSLTPLNLLISATILLVNHEKWTRQQITIFVLIAALGFGVEVLGVKTEVIFGSYFYEDTLGWKLFDTSLIIGLNWLMLSYYAVYSFASRISNIFLLSLISSFVLVGLDVLIEPIAIKYDFWEWRTSEIPLQNFIAWWLLAFVFCWMIAKVKKDSVNKVAPYLLIIQILFFGILNIVK
jgi:putative membrane protein